jgi:PAS domain S-box-containing protein
MPFSENFCYNTLQLIFRHKTPDPIAAIIFHTKEKKMGQFLIARRYPYFIAGMLVFLGLYLASLYSYLLFHSLAEIFSIVVACGIFMVTWNSRRFLNNNYLIFLGTAYLFAGGLDLVHTLTYKGMGVFQGYGTNLATQLWIAARYTESLSLLIAPLFFRRKLKINLLFSSYLSAFLLLLISIFYWNIFPICFVEGVGLTPFKKISEYIISLILLASIALLLKNRSEFDRDIFKWVIWSILLAIASELAFTFYANAYGFSNLLGHFFKIVSFYLIYKALIEMGLTRPYDLLFRNVKRSEMMVREEKNRLQNYLDIAGVILVAIDANQTVSLINKKGCEILGYEEKEVIGKNWFDTFIQEGIREEVKAEFGKLMRGEIGPVEYLESPVLTKTGEERMVAWHNAVLRDEKGKVLSTLSSGEDITERKQMEAELTRLASFPQLNPNPVVEVDLVGHVHYFNPAAEGLFPDLRKAGLNHPWLMDLEKIGETLKTEARKAYGRELSVEDRWYQQTIHSVKEGTRLRIYGFDITERKRAEQESGLLRNEAENEKRRLEAVMESLPVGVAITDTQGGNIRSNKAFEQIWGSSRPETVSVSDYTAYKAWWSDTGKLVVPEEWASAQAVQKGESVVGQLLEIRRFDGSRASVINSGAPIFDADGKIAGCAVAIQDITGLRRAEQALRRSEERLRRMVEASQIGIGFGDSTGRIFEANESFFRITGYSRKEILDGGIGWERLTAPEYADIDRLVMEQLSATGVAGPYEKEYIRNDGSRIPILVSVARLSTERDEHAAFIVDLTERKRAEESLRKSNERYELLSDTASRLLATDQPQEIVNELCQKVMAHLDCQTFFNYLADEEKQRLHLNAYSGIPEETGKEIEWLDYGAAVCGCAAHDASRIVCENIPTTPDPRTELVKSFGIKAYACHPLLSAGRVIGTLSFGTRSRTAFTEEDLSLMKTVADQVATAMEKVSLIDALRNSHDNLEIRIQERTKEVREQSRVLDSFFKFSITPFVILDKDFNFIRVNEAYAKACHRDVSEFLGHNHFEYYPSDAKAKFEQVVQTKQPHVATARPFGFPDHPEWGVTYWDWILTPTLDDAGEVKYLVFSLEDVTERKRAEEAIRRERQRFYDVLEMLPAYLVLLTSDYHVPFANRFFRERFGESNGHRRFEYLFGRTEPCEVCETYTVLKTMAPHKWEWTGPDGRIYDVTDFPLTDTDGSPLILEMGIDITERKRAEEALRAVHQYNRSLIEASPDPLVTIDSEGKVTDVNMATELATGISREQLIGSDFSDYFTEPEKAREGYRTAFLKGTVRDYPLAIRHTSGMITDVLYNATIYRNETGEIQGVFAAARDITERKRAEEALKESEIRLRALSSQLLTAQESERKRIAMELHDGIGQMLTAIKFKVETILQEKGKARAKEKSLEAIIPMVKETVDEVRRMQMDLRPSTLDDLGILATLGWLCREYQKFYPHIRIEKEIGLQESEVPTPLRTVIYRVTQEAMNNIAKHSKADLIQLLLGRREDKIELIIKDNGTGFDLEETFSPERSQGGLGLSSMRERTELSGGTFAIESTRGKGTTIKANWSL